MLRYEDAITLKDVARESQNESKAMLFLTVRNIRWRNLAYFPNSFAGEKHKRCSGSQDLDHHQSYILAFYNCCCESAPGFGNSHLLNDKKNFFSTQFVHNDPDGNLALSGNAWILAAITFPLTAITIALWWTWTTWTNMVRPPTTEQTHIRKVVRYNSFRSLLSSRRGRELHDLEEGVAPGPFSARTWSTAGSGAVTGKLGKS